ncbi:MAG: sn-glycerol-1-phosphate dehydrogenase [Proteiniphilum sp.]|nr:sn-glycerol-1-phosphate dehydrogenase [Proteiniphilum sp.]
MLKIENSLQFVNDTKALIIEPGAINRVGDLFMEQFPGKKAVIVSDQYIIDHFGDLITERLNERMIVQEKPYIFQLSELAATYENVTLLENSFRAHEAIPIAVGSGIVNDLVKLSAHNVGRKYMSVVTAASVDGYTAFGSSVTFNGSKQTFSCPAPHACLADVDIIRAAPLTMTAAGYADVFAKVTAGADWLLADFMGVEPLNPEAWQIIQEGLHRSLSNPEGIRGRDRDAIALLTERLMLCGLAMQQAKSTRPASGAEHHFSHLWNMEHHEHNNRAVPHGFQIAIGTLALTAFYEQMLQTPIDEELDVDLCCSRWPSHDQILKEAEERFGDTDFLHIAKEEMEAKYITSEQLREQLLNLKRNWKAISDRLAQQIIPFEEVKRRLKVVGAPVEPEEIGIPREYLRETFHRALFIRRRFTILDLGVRTCMTEKWLDAIFGPDGKWPIEK